MVEVGRIKRPLQICQPKNLILRHDAGVWVGVGDTVSYGLGEGIGFEVVVEVGVGDGSGDLGGGGVVHVCPQKVWACL